MSETKEPSQQEADGGGDPSREGKHHVGGSGKGKGNLNKSKSSMSSKSKFRGNCAELEGNIYDCSNYRQADMFVTTTRRIAEHMGANYSRGGDIRRFIENGQVIAIPRPEAPVTPANGTPDPVAQEIFKHEIQAYVKRKSMLNENIQKAHSLVLGQVLNC